MITLTTTFIVPIKIRVAAEHPDDVVATMISIQQEVNTVLGKHNEGKLTPLVEFLNAELYENILVDLDTHSTSAEDENAKFEKISEENAQVVAQRIAEIMLTAAPRDVNIINAAMSCVSLMLNTFSELMESHESIDTLQQVLSAMVNGASASLMGQSIKLTNLDHLFKDD